MEKKNKNDGTEKITEMRKELSALVEKYNNTPSFHKRKKKEFYKEIMALDWKINEEMKKAKSE